MRHNIRTSLERFNLATQEYEFFDVEASGFFDKDNELVDYDVSRDDCDSFELERIVGLLYEESRR